MPVTFTLSSKEREMFLKGYSCPWQEYNVIKVKTKVTHALVIFERIKTW